MGRKGNPLVFYLKVIKMPKQRELTKEEVIKLYDSEFWKEMNAENIALFQLTHERMCMPLDVFKDAVQESLGRPVWTHEYASSNVQSLINELLGKKKRPTFEEIMDLIPESKRIIIVI